MHVAYMRWPQYKASIVELAMTYAVPTIAKHSKKIRMRFMKSTLKNWFSQVQGIESIVSTQFVVIESKQVHAHVA